MSNLDDIRVKGTEVTLKGKVFHLKYDLNAFAELEDKYGSINKAINGLKGEIEKDEEGKPIQAIHEVGDPKFDADGEPIYKKTSDGKLELDNKGKPIQELYTKSELAFDKDGKPIWRRTFSMKLLRTLLWSGLLHENSKLTEQEVGSLEFSDLKDIIEAVGNAIQNSMPKLTKEEELTAKAEAKFEEEKKKENPNFTKEAKS